MAKGHKVMKKNGNVKVVSFDATVPSTTVPSTTKSDLAALKRALVETLDLYHEAWKQLPEGKALRLEREGQPFAVVMGYQDFEAILERLEDLEDAQSARDALEAIRNGEETTVPWEKLKADLTAEGLLDK